MASGTIKMSSKGQIVIPRDIRDLIGAGEGTLFNVLGVKDAIILKKITLPSEQELLRELEAISSEGKRRLQEKGFKEKDLRELSRISR